MERLNNYPSYTGLILDERELMELLCLLNRKATECQESI